MNADRKYVLGTHDEEIARLGLQHRVWQDQVLDTWRRAGITQGQTVIDIGCGAGDATLDLAQLVGPEGLVVALDQSRRFLDVVEARARKSRMENIRAFQVDLDRDALPGVCADAAWNRWVMSFLRDPRSLLRRVAARLKPGGALIVHEYFDYATWRTAPPSPAIDGFVDAVIREWRASGGEPDLGLHLPAWLDETGFEVREVRPLVDVVAPATPKWQWLAAFVESGRKRLEELKSITPAESQRIADTLAGLSSDKRTRMITPAVFEIIATRR